MLIATVGPTSVNRSETLSTLQFASRCMHVKSAPITNEEIDYADLCAHLQEKLAKAESEKNEALTKQAERYEEVIEQMSGQIETLCNDVGEGGGAAHVVSENVNYRNSKVDGSVPLEEQAIRSEGMSLHNVYETVRQICMTDVGLQARLGNLSRKMSDVDVRSSSSAAAETTSMENNDPHSMPSTFGPHILDTTNGMEKIRER